MVRCCTAASAPGPRNWISPMWLTSKSPTPVRTAMCSAIRPPPELGIPATGPCRWDGGHGYSTGMSHPPKSTIFAFSARCVALSAVFFSCAAGAAGPEETGVDETGVDETGVDIGGSLSSLYLNRTCESFPRLPYAARRRRGNLARLAHPQRPHGSARLHSGGAGPGARRLAFHPQAAPA